MNHINNNETLATFKEADDMKAHSELYKTYDSVKEMFEDIMKDATDDAGFQNRCEEVNKDFKEIDYLKENFERNEVKS